MKSIFAKMNPQALSAVLSIIQSNENCVIYLVDPTYQKQFYLSPSYELIWGRSVEPLYNDMSIWHTTVHDQDLQRVTDDMNMQFKQGEIPLNNLCYRIHQPNGEPRFLKCLSFPLYNNSNVCTAIIGIIENIQEDHYHNLMLESGGGTLDKVKTELSEKTLALSQSEWDFRDTPIKMPENEIPYEGRSIKTFYYLKVDNVEIKLSLREIQCIACLRLGLTAKRTADRLNISFRTVERHFENLKHKLNCRNKYALAQKLMKIDIPDFGDQKVII